MQSRRLDQRSSIEKVSVNKLKHIATAARLNQEAEKCFGQAITEGFFDHRTKNIVATLHRLPPPAVLAPTALSIQKRAFSRRYTSLQLNPPSVYPHAAAAAAAARSPLGQPSQDVTSFSSSNQTLNLQPESDTRAQRQRRRRALLTFVPELVVNRYAM
jgi:hypothetical protein